MTNNKDKEYYEDIFNLAEQITGLADRVFPYYEAFAEEVISDRITDIKEIERELDYILSYCFDNRILLLYKKILRKIYKQYPDVAKFYIDAYYDMFESDIDDEFSKGFFDNFSRKDAKAQRTQRKERRFLPQTTLTNTNGGRR